MKRRIKFCLNIVLTSILTLFCVGCSEDSDTTGTIEKPFAIHNITGSVTGKDDIVVEGVKVIIVDKENIYNNGEVTKTDSLGNYSFELRVIPKSKTKYIVTFTDIDGAKNGSYFDKTTELIILENELNKDEEDGLYHGSVTKDISVQLKESSSLIADES